MKAKFTPGKWSKIRAYEDKPLLFDIVGGHPATTIIARDVHSSNVPIVTHAPEMYGLLERLCDREHVDLCWEARCLKAEIDGEG